MMKRTFGIALTLSLIFNTALNCAIANPQKAVAQPQPQHQPSTLLEKILSDPSLASDDPKKSIDALMNIMAQLSPEEIALLDAEINANFDQNQRAELENMGNSVLQELGYLAPETPGIPSPQIVIPAQTHAEIVAQSNTHEAELRNLELLLRELNARLKSLQHKLAVVGAFHTPWHEDLSSLVRYLDILQESSMLPNMLKNEFYPIIAALNDLNILMGIHEPRYATGIAIENNDDNPYDLLGVTSQATQAEIDDTYEQLKADASPAVIRSELIKQGLSGKDLARAVKDAQRAWSLIEDAYEQLSDKNLRAQIDRAQANERKAADAHRAQSEDALANIRHAINELVYQQQLLAQLQMFLRSFEPEKMAALQKLAKESEARIKEQAARFEREKNQVGKEYIMLDKWRQIPYWSNNSYQDPMQWGQWPYAGWNDSPYSRDAWRDMDRENRGRDDSKSGTSDQNAPNKKDTKKKDTKKKPEEDQKKKQQELDKRALQNMRKDLKKRTENIRALIKDAAALLELTAQAAEKNGNFTRLLNDLGSFLQTPFKLAEAATPTRQPVTLPTEQMVPTPEDAQDASTTSIGTQTEELPLQEEAEEDNLQEDPTAPKKLKRRSKRRMPEDKPVAVVTMEQLKKQAQRFAESMLSLRKETRETELALVLEKIATIASLEKDTKAVRDAANEWQDVSAKYRKKIQDLINTLRAIVENPQNIPDKAVMLINSAFNQGTVISMQLDLLTNIARVMDDISARMPRQKKEPKKQEPKLVYVSEEKDDDEDEAASDQLSESW